MTQSPKTTVIAASILSADFSRLGEEVQSADAAGVDWIHVDVMDGRYVPNLTVGPLVINVIRPMTAKPLNVHLMILEPERYITFSMTTASLTRHKIRLTSKTSTTVAEL